jgi:hypothetical protein
MKTLILSALLIFGLSGTNHSKPIVDIYSIEDPTLIEEAYVDDIPFNTWEIAVEAIIGGDEVKLSEEPYVDDIPFDTREIANKCLLRKIEGKCGEANVNDIPFDTEKIMVERLTAELTEQYRNEKNTCDLPGEQNYIICNINDGQISFITVKPISSF